MTASGECAGSGDLLGAALPLFDDDHLAAAVITAIRADVMDHVRLAAGIAGDEDRHVLDEVVPPPIPLTVAGDSLFWQGSHRSNSRSSPCIGSGLISSHGLVALVISQ